MIEYVIYFVLLALGLYALLEWSEWNDDIYSDDFCWKCMRKLPWEKCDKHGY